MSGTLQHVTTEVSVFFSDGISIQFFWFNSEREFFITGGESTRCLDTINFERCRCCEGTLRGSTSSAKTFISVDF